jgi:hypothetical protein
VPFNFKKAPAKEEACCLPSAGMTDDEFASFCKTPEEIKRIPNGRIVYADGTVLYKDGAGQSWTRESWITRFGYDPKPVWNRMRRQKIVVAGEV